MGTKELPSVGNNLEKELRTKCLQQQKQKLMRKKKKKMNSSFCAEILQKEFTSKPNITLPNNRQHMLSTASDQF